MLGYLRHLLLGPLVRLWLGTSPGSWRQLPRPSDDSRVHAPGADSDRILLFGSGMAVGYGVVAHELGLGGHLARLVSSITGRGASLDVVADSNLPIPAARALLARTDLARFDALVVIVGGVEALSLVTRASWRSQLDGLLDQIEAATPATLRILVVEIWMPAEGLPLGFRGMISRTIAAFNAEIRKAVASRERARFVPFNPRGGRVMSLVARETYLEWASLLAPAVSSVLDEQFRVGRYQKADDENARLSALQALDVYSMPTTEVDQIVASARDLFGASGAALTIVDSDVRRTIAARGMRLEEVPRGGTLCTIAIERAGVLIIEDTTTDARAAKTVFASGEEFRFFAAYPIEAPDGNRIGTLCVVDTRPRTFSAADAALLRQLAVRVQSLIWAHAKDRASSRYAPRPSITG